MLDLALFQSDLARAIREPDYSPPGLATAGLSVYRNTVAKGLIDVLRANFPTVERIAGEEWFAACASLFIRKCEPRSPVLATYGESFPGFLRSFGPAADIPYLADVAQVDALWTQSHFAADDQAFDPGMLQSLDEEELLALPLRLHASTRIVAFDAPISTIWRLNRPPAPGDDGISIHWRPEAMALYRPRGEVLPMPLSAWQFAFLDACRDTRSFGDAIGAAQEQDADFGADGLGQLLAAGLFSAPDLSALGHAPTEPVSIQSRKPSQ